MRGLLFFILISIQAVAGDDNAAYVSQKLPSLVTASEVFNTQITFTNTGETSWVGTEAYRVGAQNPADNYTWGINRVALEKEETVPPGEKRTFVITLTAPSQPGTYSYQWRMVQGASSWFGDPSPNTAIIVVGANWLKRVYRDILGRTPNTKESQAATKVLSSGLDLYKIPLGIMISTDNAKNITSDGFQRMLGRFPTEDELKGWKTGAVQSGLREVLLTLAGSEEYFLAQGGTNKAFVTALYRDFLYSLPNGDLDRWIQAIENDKKSRREIAEGFVTSEWFYTNLVSGWFRKYLHRSVDERGTDLAPYAADLAKGIRWEEVLAHLLTADEYQLQKLALPAPQRALTTSQ